MHLRLSFPAFPARFALVVTMVSHLPMLPLKAVQPQEELLLLTACAEKPEHALLLGMMVVSLVGVGDVVPALVPLQQVPLQTRSDVNGWLKCALQPDRMEGSLGGVWDACPASALMLPSDHDFHARVSLWEH